MTHQADVERQIEFDFQRATECAALAPALRCLAGGDQLVFPATISDERRSI